MPSALSLDAVLNLSLGAITRGKDAEREIAKHLGEAASKGVQAGLKRGTAAAASGMEATWAKLLQSGMKKAGDTLRNAYAESARKQEATANDIADLQRSLEKEEDEGQKRRLIREKEQLQWRLKAEKKSQEKLLKKAGSAAEERMEMIENAQKRIDRSTSAKAKEAGENFSSMVGGALSMDSLDASSFAEKLTGGLQSALQSGAGRLAASDMGKTEGGASAVAGLGKAAAALGATAGVLAGIVALFAAAYGQAKEMNKALVEGVGAADLMSGSGANLKDSLADLRKTSINVAMDLRVAKEEVIGAIVAFNDAGLTLREFSGFVGGATNEVRSLEAVTTMAIVASQALGVSVSDIADTTGKMNRDLGAGLDEIQGAFGMISSEADKAGMNTKDFFSAINEASSGMALYNFRVGDTVGLFKDLVEILGEDLAKSQIGLEGTFRGQGMQERVKSTMLMGTGRARRIATADAAAQGTKMGKVGDIDLASKGGRQQLASMSGADFRKIYGEVADAQTQRQLVTMRELSQAENGGLMNVAASLGSLSKTGELAAQLSQGAALTGGKAISEVRDPMMIMMLQESLGISGEQWETMKRMDIGLRTEFEQLRSTAEAGDSILSTTFEEALAGGLLSQSKILEEGAELQYTTAERLGRDSLRETRSISQVLSNVIAGLLEKVHSALEFLVGIFTRLKGDTREKRELGARRRSQEREVGLRATSEGLGTQILDKQTALSLESSQDERMSISAEIESLQAQQDSVRAQIEAAGEFQSRLARGWTIGGAAQGTLGDMSPADVSAAGLGERVKQVETPYDYASGSHAFTTDVVDWESLTEDEIALLAATQIDAQAAERERQKQAEDQLDILKTGFVDLIGTVEGLERGQARTELETMFGTEAALEAFAGKKPEKLLAAIREGGVTAREAELATKAGLRGVLEAPVEDFVYRGDGRSGSITPIDNMDQLFGAKPGGALDRGSKSGKGTVNIVINGGDEARVYAVVKKALRDSGYENLRSY